MPCPARRFERAPRTGPDCLPQASRRASKGPAIAAPAPLSSRLPRPHFPGRAANPDALMCVKYVAMRQLLRQGEAIGQDAVSCDLVWQVRQPEEPGAIRAFPFGRLRRNQMNHWYARPCFFVNR
jgi:hypothetical protein